MDGISGLLGPIRTRDSQYRQTVTDCKPSAEKALKPLHWSFLAQMDSLRNPSQQASLHAHKTTISCQACFSDSRVALTTYFLSWRMSEEGGHLHNMAISTSPHPPPPYKKMEISPENCLFLMPLCDSECMRNMLPGPTPQIDQMLVYRG